MNAAQRKILSRSLFMFAGACGVLIGVDSLLLLAASSTDAFVFTAVMWVVLFLLTPLSFVAGLYVRAGGKTP
jgi:hypothetical protein